LKKQKDLSGEPVEGSKNIQNWEELREEETQVVKGSGKVYTQQRLKRSKKRGTAN